MSAHGRVKLDIFWICGNDADVVAGSLHLRQDAPQEPVDSALGVEHEKSRFVLGYAVRLAPEAGEEGLVLLAIEARNERTPLVQEDDFVLDGNAVGGGVVKRGGDRLTQLVLSNR